MCYKNDFVQKLVQVLFLMGFFFGGGGYITFWGLMFDLTLRYRSNQNTVVLQILRQRKAHLRFRSVTRVNDIHACCWYPMVR